MTKEEIDYQLSEAMQIARNDFEFSVNERQTQATLACALLLWRIRDLLEECEKRMRID